MLIETKEVLEFREFMKKDTTNMFITNIIFRMEDEFEYEGRKAYSTAIKEYFSEKCNYKIISLKGSGRRFVITLELNNFQKAEITINSASYKWRILQSKSKALALVGN